MDLRTFATICSVQLWQAHYPERLALAVICRPPTLFWLMWTASQVLSTGKPSLPCFNLRVVWLDCVQVDALYLQHHAESTLCCSLVMHPTQGSGVRV